MDQSKQIADFTELILMRLVHQVETIDLATFVIILIILVGFAAASRRLLFFIGGTLVALVGFLLLLVPNSAAMVLAIGAGLGSLLIAFAGIRSRRREAVECQKFDELSHIVRQLQSAQEREFLQSLNSQSRKVSQAQERTPTATGDDAEQKRHKDN
jgi:hypothetical protein